MLDGAYFHLGYVTRDIGKAVDLLSRLYGMHFEYLLTGDEPEQAGVDMRLKLALGWHGNLEYELIEPVSGEVDFYREILPADFAPRLHHTGILVGNWDHLMSDITAQGFPIVRSGELGDINYAYVDMRATLGHYVEYMWMSEAYRAWRWRGASL